MASHINFGFSIPQLFESPQGISIIPTAIRRAEELNFDSLWVSDNPLSRKPSLEPLLALTYASNITNKMKLGVATLLIPLRNPLLFAKQVATLDQLSRGRLILGISLGAETDHYPAFGITSDRRVSRFIECFKVMKKLWTESTVSFEGEFWQLKDVASEPKPYQKPHLPVWFGAGSEPALRRTARLADGWIGAGGSTVEQFRESYDYLMACLSKEGRDRSAFPVGKRIYIHVTDRKEEDTQKILRLFKGLRPDPAGALIPVVVGNARECAEVLKKVVSIGAGLVVLHPYIEHLEQLELLARDVLTKL